MAFRRGKAGRQLVKEICQGFICVLRHKRQPGQEPAGHI